MKIEAIMIPDPITIGPQATIEDALQLMKINSIRHLPVVHPDGTLAGLVTLADLRLGLIPALIGDVSLPDLMVKDPICVHPSDDIETAARRIYKYKISGIPVVRDTRLLGIITETDILRTFIDMMGLLTASSRLDVVIQAKSQSLQEVLKIIEQSGGQVINVGRTAMQAASNVYYVRLRACKTATIKKALQKHGYEVLYAMD
jgi:acetoin utilization protein AcuB